MLFVADYYCGVGDCELLTYLLLKHFISRHVKVLLITAIIPLAFLETIMHMLKPCICVLNTGLLSDWLGGLGNTFVKKFSFQRRFKQVKSLKQHVQNNELFHKVGARGYAKCRRLEVRLHAWTYGVSSM